ncbi:PQQ-binding-like beta-propeller repeat protein [Acanthopleuribacter pedis]|uniref:PQQ-like beta-propeller repeat protein n=1 Tax=Acanthopleuribacter pedis TaxID=442870 RepID=A0A8J7Q2C9_9BACT|nr:PQQ-binding-like beta-propeller repeat protein [Acanthopleuribacter pedis]MBO1317439.1 PQQ-like beta-propeller repeat protein [Acanthopleuribacter pedis]
MSQEHKGPRWWPLLVIWGLAGTASLVMTFSGYQLHERPLLIRAVILIIAAGLTGLWLVFFSRLRWLTRFAVIAAGLVGMFLFNLAFETHMTGDLVPEFRARFRTIDTQLGAGDAATAATDYAQFMGPSRRAYRPDLHLETDWEENPPEQVWRRPVGAAWSAFAVAGNLAITQEQQEEEECVIAYQLATGEEVWRQCVTAKFATTIGGSGPRATPTIHENRVYAMGALGDFMVLDRNDGRVIWQTQLFEKFAAVPPEWGSSVSPLVVDNLIVVSMGHTQKGTLAAFNREDGTHVWTAQGDPSHYSSPTLMTLGGQTQIVIFASQSVRAFNPSDGATLWSYAWPAEAPVVAIPVQVDDTRLIVSAGYGMGAGAISVTAVEDGSWQVEEQWRNINLKAKFANMIVIDGFVYSMDNGIMTCVDVNDGERRWKRGRFGHGQMIRAGKHLLVTTEKGEVVLMDPNPEAYRELGRFQAVEGKSWNPAALADNFLLVRNAEEAACFRLKTDEPAVATEPATE